VGQRGPITQIVSGCASKEREESIKQRHATLGLPEQHMLHFVEKFNDDESHVINKPLGVAAWFREVGTDRDIVACVDPDFVFVRPLTPTMDGADEAIGWTGPEPKPTRIQKGVVGGQRWLTFIWPTESQAPFLPTMDAAFQNMTPDELQTWICSGSTTGPSGCTGVTKEEVSYYHGSGPPMLAHREDWEEWLVDAWSETTKRLHQVYKKYYVDMLSYTLANIHHRKRQLIVNNLELTKPGLFEPWDAVKKAVEDVDPCTAPMDQVLSRPDLAYFVHYTHYMQGWNKRWFNGRGVKHLFERCDATEDDSELRQFLDTSADSSNRTEAFTPCVMRRFFAAGLRRSCAGRPAAAAVEKVAAGFEL